MRAFLIALAVSVVSFPSFAKADITTGLVGYWNFDAGSGTIASDSAGSNNGTLTNGPTWVAGKVESGAVSFDGVDDYVTASNESNFDFDTNSPFSISAWVYYESKGGSGAHIIAAKIVNAGNFPGYEFSIDDSNERLRVFILGTDGSIINFSADHNTLRPGAWHHAVVTVDGSGTAAGIKLYVDGSTLSGSVGGGPLTGAPLNNNPLVIGYSQAGGSPFKGKMDDVRVYNRALTSSDISELYTAVGGSGGSVGSGGGGQSSDTTSSPVISVILTGSVTSAGATITWNTDEQADTQVEYGLTTSYGSNTTLNTQLSTSHTQTLSGLSSNTLYHYRVKSGDVAGNLATSPDQTFTTVQQSTATVNGSTITAATCSQADVNAAIILAGASNTVVIPAGTCNWTSGITWTAPANTTLRGAGTSATGGGDQTIIIDDIAVDNSILAVTIPSQGVFRLNGVTFKSGSGVTKDKGSVAFHGPGNLRIDHVHWVATSPSNYQAFHIGTGVFGVLDHSILDFAANNGIYVFNSRNGTGDIQSIWGNTTMGNYEWSLPTGFGTGDFFFVEDNIVNGISPSLPSRMWDIFSAGRAVARFNSFAGASIGETHGTGHAGDDRGARAQEAYGNALAQNTGQAVPNFVVIEIQTGGGLFWGNYAPSFGKNGFWFNVTRKNNDTYAQNSAWWGYCGTQFNGSGSAWDGNTDVSTGYPCIDQPGRGPGDILSGIFPNKINVRTGTVAYPNQTLEPIYIWSNVVSLVPGWGHSDLTDIYSSNTGGRVLANRDYYPQASGIQTLPTSPFNGTSGTGWGALANRPTTCTAGVGYFATDQGNWNQSTSNPYGVQQNGADGVLYKCTTTNTWTLYYIPYTYPHPLVSGSVPLAPYVPPTTPSTSSVPPTPSPTLATSTSPLTDNSCTSVKVTAPTQAFFRSLTLGSTGSEVQALQKFLNSSGYQIALSGAGSPGKESTYFGPATAAALAKYQLANKISPASGYFGPLTMASINSKISGKPVAATTCTSTPVPATPFQRDLTIGSTGSDVLALQKYLNKAGYQVSLSGTGSPGKESTYFGPATQAALAKFQRARGITPASGYFGPKTRALIK